LEQRLEGILEGRRLAGLLSEPSKDLPARTVSERDEFSPTTKRSESVPRIFARTRNV
jgi:hypothetical protein